MPPAVAATNVIGEFQEDIKTFGGVAWGHRVNGSDQMLVAMGPRGSVTQGQGATTAQRIMKTNGIKPPKHSPPLKPHPPPPAAHPHPLPPPAPAMLPPAAAGAAAGPAVAAPGATPGGVVVGGTAAPLLMVSGSGRQKPPKLAAVIEEPRPPGCCFFLFSRGSAATPSPRPGPANDPVLSAAPLSPSRTLTTSVSARGAPSVLRSSFRQANQSIKRVPQSARSRGASARSRTHSAGRSELNGNSDWDDPNEGEFEELEDFIGEDDESVSRGPSSTMLQEMASFSTCAGGLSRTPSRATSNAIAAYRESNKTAPKSILKSAKRDSRQMQPPRVSYSGEGGGAQTGGAQSELAGRSRVMLTDGNDGDTSPLYGANPIYASGGAVQPMPTYGAPAPPGFTSTSVGPTGFMAAAAPAQASQIIAAAMAGASGAGGGVGAGAVGSVDGGSAAGGGGGGGGDWQTISVMQGGGGGLRNGPSSIKLTAEELLGLLMAQGKLTEHDVQELGLAPGAELRGSPGYPNGSPNCHSPLRYGSGGPGNNLGGGGSPGTQSSGNSGARQHPFTAGGSQAGGADAAGATQRVRFSASQVPQLGEVAPLPQSQSQPQPSLMLSSSHRVRFGDDDGGAAAPVLPQATSSAGPATSRGSAAVRGPSETVSAPSTPWNPGARALGPTPSSASAATSTPTSATAAAAVSVADVRRSFPAPVAESEAAVLVLGGPQLQPQPQPLSQSPQLQLQPDVQRSARAGRPVVARDGSLDLELDEVLNTGVLQLGDPVSEPCPAPVRISVNGAPPPPSAALSVAASSSTAAAAPPSTAAAVVTAAPRTVAASPSRSPQISATAEALRLSPPGALPPHDPLPPTGSVAAAIRPSAAPLQLRSPILRSSDSGVLRAGAQQAPMLQGGQGPGPGGSRLGQALRLSSAANAQPPALLSSPGGASLLGSSRPGSAGSNNSGTPMSHWGPHAGGAAGFASAASATVPGGGAAGLMAVYGGGRGPPEAAASRSSLGRIGAASGGGSAGGGGGGGSGGGAAAAAAAGGSALGAVDRMAMRKLQSHMNRSNASRHTASSGGGGESMNGRGFPMRQPSRSNWVLQQQQQHQLHPYHQYHDDSDFSDEDGPGTPDREGGDTRCHASQHHLQSRPSGRSVRFTAPVVFELQQSGESDDGGSGGRRRGDPDEDREERDAVAAAAAAAARSRVLRSQANSPDGAAGRSGDGLLWHSNVSGMDSVRSDKAGAWM